MAKEILYRIEFEGSEENLKTLTEIQQTLRAMQKDSIKLSDEVIMANEKEKLDRQELLKLYRKEQQAIKDKAKENKAVAGSLEQLRLEAKRLGQQLEKTWAVGTPEFKKAADALEQVNRKIRTADKSAGNFKSNIGNYAGSIGDAFQGVGLNVGKLQGTIGSLGAATAAGGPLGIGLAAIAGGVQLLGGALSATDDIADKFERTIQGAKDATDVFFKAIATGDFSNLIGNMREAVRIGKEYADTLDRLEDKKRAQDIQDAKSRVTILKLQKELRNVNLSNTERIEIGKQILEIEDQNAKKRVANAEILVNAELKRTATINKLSKAELQDIIENFDAYEKRFDIVAQLLDAEKRLREEKARSGGGASGFDVADQKEVARLTTTVEKLRAATAGYSSQIIAFGSVAKGERDALKESLIGLYNEQASYDELTMRTESRLNSLVKAENTATTTVNNQAKAVNTLNAEFEKLIPTYGDLLKMADSMQFVDKFAGSRKAMGARFGIDDEQNVPDDIDTAGVVAKLNEESQFTLSVAADTAGQFVSIWQSAYSMQADIRTQELDRQLKAGLISEKQYEREVAKIRTDQAKKDKVANIIQAVSNAAQGVLKAMAQSGLVGAAIAAAIGAAQVGLILSQPDPVFAKGGMIDVGGNSHASGGTKFVGSDGSRFEAERGEVITVVNKHDSKRLRALSDLNSEHGRAFYGSPSGAYFASGGMFNPNQNIGAFDTGLMVRKIVSEMTAIPVQVSLNEIENKADLKRKVNVIGAL